MANQINENSTGVNEELRIIKEMIATAQRNTADNGIYFIVWGWLVMIACLATFGMLMSGNAKYIWIAWVTLTGIGWIFSITTGYKQGKTAKVTSHMDTSVSYLWIACGVTMGIIGFVGSLAPNFSYKTIFPAIALVSGIGTFVTGGMLEIKSLKTGGIIWGLAGVSMLFAPTMYHPLITAVAIIPGYLVPGYVLRKDFKPSEAHEPLQTA